jgi:hypothetical protein
LGTPPPTKHFKINNNARDVRKPLMRNLPPGLWDFTTPLTDSHTVNTKTHGSNVPKVTWVKIRNTSAWLQAVLCERWSLFTIIVVREGWASVITRMPLLEMGHSHSPQLPLHRGPKIGPLMAIVPARHAPFLTQPTKASFL